MNISLEVCNNEIYSPIWYLGKSLVKAIEGRHLDLLFMFLQYYLGCLFSNEVFGDVSPGNKCSSIYFIHAVSIVERIQSLI